MAPGLLRRTWTSRTFGTRLGTGTLIMAKLFLVHVEKSADALKTSGSIVMSVEAMRTEPRFEKIVPKEYTVLGHSLGRHSAKLDSIIAS